MSVIAPVQNKLSLTCRDSSDRLIAQFLISNGLDLRTLHLKVCGGAVGYVDSGIYTYIYIYYFFLIVVHFGFSLGILGNDCSGSNAV